MSYPMPNGAQLICGREERVDQRRLEAVSWIGWLANLIYNFSRISNNLSV